MSIAPDAIDFVDFAAEDQTSLTETSSILRHAITYIISNRDQNNLDRHKSSTRTDLYSAASASWTRFPYTVPAYYSDQHDGDWLLDLLSYLKFAPVRESEGEILDFSDAGYLVMKDHNDIAFEAKLPSLGLRSRAEWQMWLRAVQNNSLIKHYLDVEHRPEFARYPLILFDRLKSMTKQELMQLFVSHSLSLQFYDMVFMDDSFSWLGASMSSNEPGLFDLWYMLPLRMFVGRSNFQARGLRVKESRENILFPRCNVFLFRRPISIYFRYQLERKRTTMIVIYELRHKIAMRCLESFENIEKLGYRVNAFAIHGISVSSVLQEWGRAMILVDEELAPIEREILETDPSTNHTSLTKELHRYLTTVHRLSSELRDLSSILTSLRKKHGDFHRHFLGLDQLHGSNEFQRFDDFLDQSLQKVAAWQNAMEEAKSRAETAAGLLFNRLTALIAVSSRQDTTGMKIIAFFTMIYLPGSFVSSIFGWSIIDFSVDETTKSQSVVVGQQWKWYVAITITLTVATFGAFWLLQAVIPEEHGGIKSSWRVSAWKAVTLQFKALSDRRWPWQKRLKKEMTQEEINAVLQQLGGLAT